MEYAEIMKEITAKLCGEQEKDLKYLFAEAAKYMDHKNAVEICRGVIRIAYNMLPEDEKSQLSYTIDTLNLFIQNILMEAGIKISEGRLNEAEKMVKSILAEDNREKEDEATIYLTFNDLMEETIYRYKYKPIKEVRDDPYCSSKIYITYAYILVEQKKYDEALKALEKGLKHNPVNVDLLFEESEIFKYRKDWQTYKRITDMCLEYSYKPKDVARVFRNYGFMFIEQADYDAAICCYLLSLHFYHHATATSELYHISKITNKAVDEKYYYENMNQILKDRGLQFGPSNEILNLAYHLAAENEKTQDYSYAVFFYKVCFDLTGDENIRKKIESITNMISSAKH